jgi:hypothetical protein
MSSALAACIETCYVALLRRTNLSIQFSYFTSMHIDALLNLVDYIFSLCFISLPLLCVLAGGSNASLASTSSGTSVSISSEFFFYEVR